MSPDLLKLRLVSKRFGLIALDIWIGAMRRFGGKTLYIDPCKRSMEETLRIFAPTDVGRAWASTITEISLEIRPIFLYKRLAKMLRAWFANHYSQEQHMTDQNIEMFVKHNLDEFCKTWKQQQDMQRFIMSSTGSNQLQMMISSMPNLRTFEVSTKSFWLVPPGNAKAHKDPSAIYWQFVPHLVKLLSALKIPRLSLRIDASFMKSMRQSFLRKLFCLRPVQLDSFTTLDLRVSNDDMVMKGQQYGEGPLALAADFHSFLARMPNLESLSIRRGTLGYTDTWGDNDFSELGEAAWLSQVLQNQYWPRLKKLELSSFILPSSDLINILQKHKTTIKEVEFDDCALDTHDEVLRMIRFLREELVLSGCFLGLGVMKDERMIGELRLLADAYCGTSQSRRKKLIPRNSYKYNDYERVYHLGHYVLKHDPPA